MIPLITAKDGSFRGHPVVAYDSDSELRGGLIVNRLNTVRRAGTEHSPRGQAMLLPREILMALLSESDRFFWFEFRNRERDPYTAGDHYGLVWKDLRLKPAYQAYSTLIRVRPAGSRSLRTEGSSDTHGGVYHQSWRRPDGQLDMHSGV